MSTMCLAGRPLWLTRRPYRHLAEASTAIETVQDAALLKQRNEQLRLGQRYPMP